MHDSGGSQDVYVCHTVHHMTSLSICQSHHMSVCLPKHELTWKSIHMSVCPSSVLSVQPSAKFMMKIPMSIATSCQCEVNHDDVEFMEHKHQ